MTPCGVCLKTRGQTNRVGGLDVCDVCFHGGVAKAVAERGWRMTTTTWVRSSNDDTTYYGQVVGWFGGAVPFTGSLRRKTAFHRWLPFWRGVKTRDPLFNRSVYALGTDGLATFLDSDGAQSAAMDLVGEGAMIKVYPGNVDVIAASDRPIVETRLEAETAVFMAHVEAYAEVHRA